MNPLDIATVRLDAIIREIESLGVNEVVRGEEGYTVVLQTPTSTYMIFIDADGLSLTDPDLTPIFESAPHMTAVHAALVVRNIIRDMESRNDG